MREILFRGKRKDSGEWVYGSLIQWKTGGASIVAPKGHINAEYGVEDSAAYPVDPATVGQHTGFCDNRGNKIFEGDIVRLSDDKLTIAAEVRWQSKHATWAVACYNELDKYVWNYLGDCPQSSVEVIGNIHDNPELLEERK